MIKNRNSVLVIEDNKDLSFQYRLMLDQSGFDVTLTDTKRGAVEWLRKKTFAAALVDLQLRDDPTHDGGVQVLEYINKTREGTQAVVVSGTPNISDAIRSFEAGISSFVQKGTKDRDDIIGAIQQAVESANPQLYGAYQSLAAFLAAPDLTPVWQYQLVEMLGCTYETLNQILWRQFKPFLPVLRKADGSPALDLFKDDKAVAGLFWSKGAGYPVWFSACAHGGQLIEPPETFESETIHQKKHHKNTAAMWRITGLDRNDFPEFIFDTPWEEDAGER